MTLTEKELADAERIATRYHIPVQAVIAQGEILKNLADGERITAATIGYTPPPPKHGSDDA
jgi:hypothetical protein